MAWVDVDLLTEAKRRLHRLAYGPRMQALVAVLVKVARDLKGEQDALRGLLLKQTSYGAETLLVEAALNDAYDPDGRRIWIENVGVLRALLYLRDVEEQRPLTYLRDPEEGRPLRYMRDVEELLGPGAVDFIVWCPGDMDPLPSPQQVAAIVNKYRPMGKRWQLNYVSPVVGVPATVVPMTLEPELI